MSWEQAAYSFDQGQPPTPSKTPTSPAFGSFFETPKVDSSFYDPRVNWNTADPHAGPSNVQRTPTLKSQNLGDSNNQPPVTPSQNFAALTDKFSSNAHKLLSTPNFHGLSSGFSPNLSGQGQGFQDAQNPGQQDLSLDTTNSFGSAGSLQTPPPTTTSAAKRRVQTEKGKKTAGKAMSARDRRMSAPLAPKPANNAAPVPQQDEPMQQFGDLDFSPDVFGYNFSGPPATAPIYPQQRLFWGQENRAGEEMNFGNDFGNPFDTPRAGGMDPFADTSQQANQGGFQSFLDFGDDSTGAGFNSLDFATAPQNQQNPSKPKQGHSGVDPSLLFSSPSKLPQPMDDAANSARVLSEESLQPYAYQVQEAKREIAMGNTKIKKRRKPSVDSPAVRAALETLRDGEGRPPIRRSMTDSVVSAVSRGSAHSNASSGHGRSSPLKRVAKPSQKRKHRTSLRLTIDENGRARTEPNVVDDSEKSGDDQMQVDDGSSDSDSSTDASDTIDEAMITSFAPRVPTIGRFNSSAPHSQKSSYASFYSAGSGSHQQEPTLPEHKHHRHSMNASTLNTLKEVTSSMEDDEPSEAETVMESDEGDLNAQSELRRVIENRHLNKGGQQPSQSHSFSSPLAGGHFQRAGNQTISPSAISNTGLPGYSFQGM